MQVIKTTGRWVLEKLNIYNPLSGVTTNLSEGFNTLLKHYEHWKEAPLDSMILGLYQLQVYFYNEIQRGYSGLGSYSLSSEFSFAAIPLDELVTVSVTSPADIVAKIRSSQESTSKIEESIKLDSDSTTLEDRDESNNIKENETIGNGNDDIGTSKTTGYSIDNDSEASQYSRARYDNSYHVFVVTNATFMCRSIIENGKISHNVKLGVFTVMGTTGNPHAVCLFPRESCTCPSSSLCYHIIAAKLSIGMKVQENYRKVNLTKLRHNTKSKKDKISGRKKPRCGDYEPAPDSQAAIDSDVKSVSFYNNFLSLCVCVNTCTILM